MAISQRIVSATLDAFATLDKAENKFVKLGEIVAAEYAGPDKFEAIKADYIAEAILPAMGAEAQKIMSAELLRKGTPAYLEKCAADPTYKDQHEKMSKAKIVTRATADKNYRRVRDYADRVWNPPVESEGEGEKGANPTTTKQAKLLKKAVELLTALQKDEQPTYKHKDAIAAAQLLVKALT
jgi:hypothetical protein